VRIVKDVLFDFIEENATTIASRAVRTENLQMATIWRQYRKLVSYVMEILSIIFSSFFSFPFFLFFSSQPKDNRCSLQLSLISEIETPLLSALSAANEFARFYRRSDICDSTSIIWANQTFPQPVSYLDYINRHHKRCDVWLRLLFNFLSFVNKRYKGIPYVTYC